MQLIQQRDRHGWRRGAVSKEGKASESLLWAGVFKCLLFLRAEPVGPGWVCIHTCLYLSNTYRAHPVCQCFSSNLKTLMVTDITYINTFVATSFHIYIYLTWDTKGLIIFLLFKANIYFKIMQTFLNRRNLSHQIFKLKKIKSKKSWRNSWRNSTMNACIALTIFNVLPHLYSLSFTYIIYLFFSW